MEARASRPPAAILVVAADETARRALLEPLERRYAQDYRVVGAAGAAAGLAAIDELRAAGGDMALVLADDASPVGDHDSSQRPPTGPRNRRELSPRRVITVPPSRRIAHLLRTTHPHTDLDRLCPLGHHS